MRKLILAMASIAMVCLAVSCQKEISGDVAASGAVTGNFKAKINGTQWVADKLAQASRTFGLINITGLGIDKKILTITLMDSGVHIYTLDPSSMGASAYIDSNSSNPSAFTTNQGSSIAQSGGQVSITSIDTTNKKISGTFSFKVYRIMDSSTVTFTEGSFTDITYSTTLPPGNGSDTFRFKVDNVPYNYSFITGINAFGHINLSGAAPSGVPAAGIQILPTATPGNFLMSLPGGDYSGVYNPDQDPFHSKQSISGSLQIIEHNTTTKRIRGTFDFIGGEILHPLNTVHITEGYFAVTYQ
jgi:hypothetical protein